MKGIAWRPLVSHANYVKKTLEGKSSFVVFDTETTGLPGKNGETEESVKIIQFSAARFSMDDRGDISLLETYNTYVNPLEPLDSDVVELTGITPEVVSAAPLEEEVVDKILSFLKKDDVWLAYNSSFDERRLYYMAKRCGKTDYYNNPTIDVLEMAKNLVHKPDVENHKLATMIGKMCPDYEAQFHDSMEDVMATAVLFEKLLKMYRAVPEREPDDLVKRTVKRVSYWENPKCHTQRKLKVILEGGDTEKWGGSICFDTVLGHWTCAANRAARDFFRATDMQNIQDQVMAKYAGKYGARNMEDIGRGMARDWRAANKAKKDREEAKSAEAMVAAANALSNKETPDAEDAYEIEF